jgi:hypothetical protein
VRKRRRRIVALVCTVCDRDLVYLETIREEEGWVLDFWLSRWFGCDCPHRTRLSHDDTWTIIKVNDTMYERVESWGSIREAIQ